MPAQILDGKKVDEILQAELNNHIHQHLTAGHRAPELAVILVGENPASKLYVRNKHRACAEVGIVSHAFTLPPSVSEIELIELVDKLNLNSNIDGILVQLPLPS